jgi:F420H(2)-dependent quinone reductase
MVNPFNTLFVGVYQLSEGKLGGKMRGFNVLLLTTVGRKSGAMRTVPLGRFDWQDGYVIVASNGGSPRHPGWYLNLKSRPQVTVQVMDKVFPATAEVLTGEARTQAWQHVISVSSQYAGYEKKTKREIPVVLLRPGQ